MAVADISAPNGDNLDDLQRSLLVECHQTAHLLHHIGFDQQQQHLHRQHCPTLTAGLDKGCIARPSGARFRAMRGQARLLVKLAERDGIPIKEMVEGFDIRPSSASELVAKLERRGLVRSESDSRDRRARKVFITDTGMAYAKRIKAAQAELRKEMFSGLTMTEQQQLLGLIRKVNASLLAHKEESNPQ
ncbi:MAG: MarR family transcriptional regulator [Actinomycetia bacterium]|nr:MarR family transcriptional regulator [Actinomycetes bacterium]